ncbi:MAG TPA: hypothetical protein VLA88_00315 [Candidatus Saccharimonadales bacterium]|nr:hypothetical protein [Candidatus Saccharimonadales bacterium]
MTQRRRLVWLLLLALGILVPASVAVASMPVYLADAKQVPVKAQPPSDTPFFTPQPDECPVRVAPHYYAFDSGKESKNAFGPPVTVTANMTDMRKLFERPVCGYMKAAHHKVGGDWALFASLKSEVDGTDRNHRFKSVDAWAGSLNEFLSRVDWNKAFLYVDNRGNTRVGTYYMVRGRDDRPDVRAATKTEPPSHYLVLPVRRHDGTVVKLILRLECGFQPVRPHERLVK